MPLARPTHITLVIIFAMSMCSFAHAQTLPIANNTNEKDRIESLMYTNYIGKYDSLVYFTSSSFWSTSKANFFAYGIKDGAWQKLIVKFKREKNGTWSKPNVKKIKCDSVPIKKLLVFLNENTFWTLDRDSLDHQFQLGPDGRRTRYSKTDGRNYEFGLMTYHGYLKMSAYEPDYFLEKMPEIKQRAVFIKCREEFFRTFDGK